MPPRQLFSLEISLSGRDPRSFGFDKNQNVQSPNAACRPNLERRRYASDFDQPHNFQKTRVILMMASSEQATTSSTGFRSQFRVVIVGAGLVGLLLAIVLRRAEYHVVVVDKDGELKEVSPARSLYCHNPVTTPMHLCLTNIRATLDWGRHHSTCQCLPST